MLCKFIAVCYIFPIPDDETNFISLIAVISAAVTVQVK